MMTYKCKIGFKLCLDRKEFKCTEVVLSDTLWGVYVGIGILIVITGLNHDFNHVGMS